MNNTITVTERDIKDMIKAGVRAHGGTKIYMNTEMAEIYKDRYIGFEVIVMPNVPFGKIWVE